MKHYKLNLMAAVVLLTVTCSSAEAQCSNATASGSYRYLWTGYGSFGAGGEHTLRPNGPFTPFAAVGLSIFNGDGTSSNVDTVNLAGGFFNRNFTNTYQIGSDCHGTVTVQGATEPTAHIVVAPDGSEIFFINSISGVVISGVYRRQAAGQCSNATTSGAYRYMWNGYGSFGEGGQHTFRTNGSFTPFAAVGQAIFDGAGAESNTDTLQLAGGVFQRTFANTHNVGSDCRGTVTRQGDIEPTAKVVVSPDGSEIFYITTIEGAVVSGSYRRQ